jgi:ATP-dependent Clp protease ATP-binding subunit ClpA
MADRLTERAKKTLALASQEARKLGQPEVGSEHLLMGLLQEGTGVGFKVLEAEGLTYEQVRDQLGTVSRPGHELPSDHILPLSSEGEAVMGSAKRQARQLGHNYVGTEHILLGLTEVACNASRMLAERGFSVDRVRQHLFDILGCPQVRGPKMIEKIGRADSEKMKKFIGPGQVDQLVRQAIRFCWMALPAGKRNAQELEAQMRRLFERAMKDLREDDAAFR